ncbi:MAG: energy transducer TonB [Gammaproteobacteria bacterium]|nr:energy transducer TonB [Gammaproteobacteria bacterium]
MLTRQGVGLVIGIGLVFGTVLTVGLLYIIQSVRTSDKVTLNDAPKVHVDFERLVEDKPFEPKRFEMDPPPPVELPPLDPLQLVLDSPVGPPVPDGWDIESQSLGLDDLSAGTWTQHGEYWPYKIPDAEWPTIALQRGLEGVVILQFDVSEEGTVENAEVIEAKPPDIFDDSALSTIAKFKYKPRILNGQPVRVTGVKNKFIYERWRSSSNSPEE